MKTLKEIFDAGPDESPRVINKRRAQKWIEEAKVPLKKAIYAMMELRIPMEDQEEWLNSVVVALVLDQNEEYNRR